jgi:hypothetical protein
VNRWFWSSSYDVLNPTEQSFGTLQALYPPTIEESHSTNIVLTRNCDKDRVLHFEVQQNGWGERLKATVVVGEVVVEVRPVVMASLKMGELARVALRDCIQLFLKTFEN